MGMFALVTIDPDVLPADMDPTAITHAQTYDLGGSDGTLQHAHMLADGRLLTDGEEMTGDFEIEVFVMTRTAARERSYDIIAVYEDGRLKDLQTGLRMEETPSPERAGFWGRMMTTLNKALYRQGRPFPRRPTAFMQRHKL